MRWTFALLLTAFACATSTPSDSDPASAPAESPALSGHAARFAEEAAGSVATLGLRALLAEHWAFVMESNPLFATRLGIHTFDDRITDVSLAAAAARREKLRGYLKRAQAIDEKEMSYFDSTTLNLFIEELQSKISVEPCRFSEWSLSPRGNPVTQWNYLPTLHSVKNAADLEKLVARYEQIPASIDTHSANLRSGAKDGLFANAESTRRVLEMVERQLAMPAEDWPLMSPVFPDHGLEAAARSPLQARLRALVEGEIRAALERYRDVVKKEILPNARPADATGLAALPLGAECYAARLRTFTTLPLDAKTVHETGLREIARIDAAMAALGKKLFDLDDRLAVLKKLRESPDLHFDTATAVEEKAVSSLARAKLAIPRWFGILPKADCVVTRIPDYEAPFTTVAYYRQPTPGTKPGEYFINVHAPTTRPRYEAEALAFHESIPGHHLQIAIAQELPALPAFRKHMGMTVFVEGWALYTEQLADEMGLYTGDLDRMGMHSYEAWRAARLVVDTGIHAFNWSREKAKTFMRDHTALAENNIDNEVDRYIVWPGQAVAYKTGQMEIWRLRRAAEKALGEDFDIENFHDAVLAGGAVTLSVLGQQIDGWVESIMRKKTKSSGATSAAP